MEKFFFLERNIDLVNQIIKTTGLIIPIFEEHKEISPVINETFKKILEFLDKIIEILPEIKIQKNDCNDLNIKNEIIFYLKLINLNWTEFPKQNLELKNNWITFSFWWEEYFRKTKILNQTDTSIFISMN